MPMAQLSELPQCIEFKFSDIREATNDFDKSLLIGLGWSRKVYKGSITVGENPDKSVVAIKRLNSSSHQGEREFLAEVDIQSKLRHKNLVSLIGYCKQERIIVSEYMSKGTLADRLHRREYPPLTWVRRLKILIATGRGLNHLHTGTGINGVIHLDMKPANILLDDNWEPKIGDFGSSRTGLTNQTSDQIRGTLGFVDPLYSESGIAMPESDVFSFGITMLEVLCGRRAIDNSLVDQNQRVLRIWAQECVRNNTLTEIVDANLKEGAGAISTECLYRFVQLAMRCLHDTADQRPTMADVVAGLESILATQENANIKRIKSMKKKIFGIKVPSHLIPFKREKNPVGGTSLKSLEFHLYHVGGEKRILQKFSFDDINAASENFSRANKILGDEVGTMYKGKLLNGQDIAIYGPSSDTQLYELYKNATSILVDIEHENLIQLLGYCIDGTNVYHVYDFAPYTTLDLLISDCSIAQRYKILQGVARALLYLHSHAPVRVMHFDVKPGKIMLDESLNPKLFGFYFARSIAMTKADCIQVEKAHRIAECWAPEYMGTNRPLSTKCDVFNFGVLVLITLTAERIVEPFNADYLEINVRKKWLEGAYSSRNKAETEMKKRFIMVGLFCIQIDATQRPGMEEVVAMLMGTSSPDALLSEIKAMNRQEWEMGIKTRKTNSARSAEASMSASHP